MLMGPVSKIRFWKDPPYSLGGVEIPSPNMGWLTDPITHEDYEEDLNKPDGYWIFSGTTYQLRPDRYTNHYELKLPGLPSPQGSEDSAFWRYCCIHTVKEYDDSEEFLIYAFITDIIQESAVNPQFTIRYTIDSWRTFNPNTVFGRGTITRCDDSSYKRPRLLQPRKRYIDYTLPLNETPEDADHRLKSCNWGIVVFMSNTYDSDGNIATSHLRELVFPIDPSGNDMPFFHFSGGSPDAKYTSPAYWMIFNGYIEEIFGLDPDAVTAFYISPICPSNSFSWNNSDFVHGGVTYHGGWVLSAGARTGVSPYSNYGCFEQNVDARKEYVISLQDPLETDDITTYVITDLQGNAIFEAPYGMPFDTIKLNLDVSSQGGYLCAFLSDSDDPQDYKQCAALGMACSIPLLQVPVTSNAWASYNYSGQREYDKEQAQIARDQQAVNGITGALGGAISGGLTGALVGAAGGPIGAAAGALIGAGTQLSGVGVNYAFSGYFNDRLQDSKDQLYSKQANTVLLTGGSSMYSKDSDTTPTGKFGYLLLGLAADSVSAQEISDDIALNGYETQIPCADVTSFITAGGPLRIENMKIGGSGVPQFAITAIKDMFARGVFIINPTP